MSAEGAASKPCDTNWAALYRRFTAPMCSFDCGSLCAEDNGGIPACCNNDACAPIIYRDELRWLRSRTNVWRKRPARTDEDRREDAGIEKYIVYATCRGVTQCSRTYRSLTCRFFPFEPYIERSGRFAGLTYVYRCADTCPIIRDDVHQVHQRYVNQSIRVWEAVFDAYPSEHELYQDESRKLRRSFTRKLRPIRVFPESVVPRGKPDVTAVSFEIRQIGRASCRERV